MAAELEKRHAVDEVNFSHEDDGFDLPGAAQLGGTDTDKYEMRVLGRIQQLNVRPSQVSSRRDMSPTNIKSPSGIFVLSLFWDSPVP